MRKPNLAVCLALAVVLAGASSALATRSARAATTVKVALLEYKIKLADESLPAGRVKLKFKNRGIEVHEVIIVRGSDPTALPLDQGVVDESAIAESDVVGESGDIDPKATKTKGFDLEPGSYVLFCNVLHDHAEDESEHTATDEEAPSHGHEEVESVGHFGEGMHVVITVE